MNSGKWGGGVHQNKLGSNKNKPPTSAVSKLTNLFLWVNRKNKEKGVGLGKQSAGTLNKKGEGPNLGTIPDQAEISVVT